MQACLCTLGVLHSWPFCSLTKHPHSPLWHSGRNICFSWQLVDGPLSFLVVKHILFLCHQHFGFDRRISSQGKQECSSTDSAKRNTEEGNGIQLSWVTHCKHLFHHVHLILHAFFIRMKMPDMFLIDHWFINTCNLIINICYQIMGASLSGDKAKCYFTHSGSSFSRHVTAGSSNTVSKFFTLQPKPFNIVHKRHGSPRRDDELALHHPDS